MRILRNLVTALIAATSLGSVAALAAEPSPEQTINGEASGVAAAEPVQHTTWNCYTVMDGAYRGQVTIWWGHTAGDAKWACDNWISTCGNSHGNCYASYVR